MIQVINCKHERIEYIKGTLVSDNPSRKIFKVCKDCLTVI